MLIARRSGLFALVAVLVSVAFDLLWWGGYQGGEPASHRETLLVVHALVHAAVLVAGFVGAIVAFGILRTRSLSAQHAAVSGLVFGMIGVVAGIAAMSLFGVLGFVVAVLAVSVVVALGGGLFFGVQNG
jgi:hypothetical protein